MALVLGSALLTVFALLPAWVESRRAGEIAPPPTAGSDARSAGRQTAPDAILSGSDTLRSEAEGARGTANDLRSAMESRGVSSWAPAEFAATVQRIAVGDKSFRAGDYAAAVTAYDEARRQLAGLEARSSQVARQALDDGARALEAGDSRAATAAFRLALQIDADNPAATVGLRRSEVVDQVMELLIEASTAEREHDLERAADHYRRAAGLDPLSEDARSGLDRVTRKIEHDEFASLMSAGLDALDRQDYLAARAAFERASTLRPGSPEAADGLARTQAGQRIHTIEEHLRRADVFERDERWESAIAEYEQVLAIDPTVASALQGRDRAAEREQLGARIDFHLGHPDRLSTDHILEEVVELLAHARTVSPRGPSLAEQIERLEDLIRVASTPVRVELQSDGLTEVVIHRVGRFGTFTRRSLNLRPGLYTVVGTRLGYRDVRVQWRVGPGMESEPLVVRCEEEI